MLTRAGTVLARGTGAYDVSGARQHDPERERQIDRGAKVPGEGAANGRRPGPGQKKQQGDPRQNGEQFRLLPGGERAEHFQPEDGEQPLSDGHDDVPAPPGKVAHQEEGDEANEGQAGGEADEGPVDLVRRQPAQAQQQRGDERE